MLLTRYFSFFHFRLDIPNAFESNIRIPNKITRPLGPQAIVLSTGVSTGLFTMLLFGGCWIGDVDNVEEFTTGLRKLLSPLNRNKAVQDKLITEGDDTTLKEIWDSFKDK